VELRPKMMMIMGHECKRRTVYEGISWKGKRERKNYKGVKRIKVHYIYMKTA
jgi:ribosomal protein S21